MLLWTLASCAEVTDSDRLRSYLSGRFGYDAGHLPLAIFVITEDGCPTCDRRFADQIRGRTDCGECLFIVRAEGSTVDLNGFLSETHTIRFDDGSFKELGLLPASGVIRTDGRVILEIVPLDVNGIGEQLSRTARLLDSLDVASMPPEVGIDR